MKYQTLVFLSVLKKFRVQLQSKVEGKKHNTTGIIAYKKNHIYSSTLKNVCLTMIS